MTKKKGKQKEFKNVMSFRGKIVSTCQLHKPLAEKHKCRNDFKWEHERIFADHSGRRFCKLGFVYFHESKTFVTYGPRAEDVERRIRNDLADAYETS